MLTQNTAISYAKLCNQFFFGVICNNGGEQQIASRIAFDEIDVLFYFRAANPYKERDVNARMDIEQNLLRLCDVHNVPVATNIATAEIIVTALDRGELDYRNFINPRSEYNIKKRNLKY